MLKLFWYSRPYLNRGEILNFGDELSKEIVERISEQKVEWLNPLNQSFFSQQFTSHILGLGSILHFGARNSLVWGSGLIDSKSIAPKAKYFAVRGKFTRQILLSRGIKVPEVYGDPGLLTSRIFPEFKHNPNFKIGVIPHYVEFDEVNSWYLGNNFTNEILMIDLRKDIFEILKQISQCKYIISSSLHGIVIPHSYGIPTIRAEFTNRIIGDGIKYNDYFSSVGIRNYKPQSFGMNEFTDTTLNNYIENLEGNEQINNDLLIIQDKLLAARPF